MDWISLNDLKQLDEILAESKTKAVLIYKQSTRCNISRTALDRLERKWDASAVGTPHPAGRFGCRALPLAQEAAPVGGNGSGPMVLVGPLLFV